MNEQGIVLSLEEILAVFFGCSLIIFVAIIVCYLVRQYLKEQQGALHRHGMEERQRRQDVALTSVLASRLQNTGTSGHQVHQRSSAPFDDLEDLACQRSQEVSDNKGAPQTSSQCLGHQNYCSSTPVVPIAGSPLSPLGQKQQDDRNLLPQLFCPEICNEPDLMEPELMQTSLRYLQPDDINKKNHHRVKLQSSLTIPRFSSQTIPTAVLTSHDGPTSNLDISSKRLSKPPMLLRRAHSITSCDLNLWPSTSSVSPSRKTIPFSSSEEEKPTNRNFRLKSSSTSSPFGSFSMQSGTLSSFPGHTPEVTQCRSSLSQLSVCALPNCTNSQRSLSTSSDNGNNCDPSLNQSGEKSSSFGPNAPARTLFKSPDPGEFSFNLNESVFFTAIQ